VAKSSEVKELKAEIEEMKERLDQKNEAIRIGRNALFAITREDPIKYKPVPGGTPTFVRAFNSAQERAEKALIGMSDAQEGRD
jgi:hypothetical protein